MFGSLLPAIVQMLIFQPPADTNTYYYVTLSWTYTNGVQPGDSFFLYSGRQSLTYEDKINVGTNLTWTIDKTNWNQSFVPHFYAVTLCRSNVESLLSGEVRFPLYSPNRVTLTWNANANTTTVWNSTDLKAWGIVSIVGGTNSVTFNRVLGREFFKLSRLQNGGSVERPTLKLWNPLNEPP